MIRWTWLFFIFWCNFLAYIQFLIDTQKYPISGITNLIHHIPKRNQPTSTISSSFAHSPLALVMYKCNWCSVHCVWKQKRCTGQAGSGFTPEKLLFAICSKELACYAGVVVLCGCWESHSMAKSPNIVWVFPSIYSNSVCSFFVSLIS